MNLIPSKSSILKLVFCVVLCFMVLGISYAQSNSERVRLENNKKKLEKEIANTQQLLKRTTANKNASFNQIQLLKEQIRQRESLIQTINSQIGEIDQNIVKKEIELSQLQTKLERLKKEYSKLVYMSFKNRKSLNKILYYLSSEDYTKMYRRMRYLDALSDRMTRQIELINETTHEISLVTENLKSEKESKTKLATSKEKEKTQLNKDQIKKNEDLAQLKKKEANLIKNLKQQQKKKREIDIAINAAIKAAMKKVTAKNKSQSSSTKTTAVNKMTLTPEEQKLSSSFASNAYKLPWPVEKGVKIGEYGIYRHPDVPEVAINNKGIDILSVKGAKARVVFSGEVSGIIDVLGVKTVLVRHGEYFSVYKNLASVYVKKGDIVTIKQNIGEINQSSNGEGSELHFEVWKNDVNLNPNSWLTPR